MLATEQRGGHFERVAETLPTQSERSCAVRLSSALEEDGAFFLVWPKQFRGSFLSPVASGLPHGHQIRRLRMRAELVFLAYGVVWTVALLLFCLLTV
jgi:hypothetical protein